MNTKQVKRYGLRDGLGIAVIKERVDGEYILYSDHVAVVKALQKEYWRGISTLDRSTMGLYLVAEDGAVRLYLWNPQRAAWEHPWPMGQVVGPMEECATPTHWMPLPDAP